MQWCLMEGRKAEEYGPSPTRFFKRKHLFKALKSVENGFLGGAGIRGGDLWRASRSLAKPQD